VAGKKHENVVEVRNNIEICTCNVLCITAKGWIDVAMMKKII